MNTMDVAIATIGKAHGLRGEVSLLLRTDQPEERLSVGTCFDVEHDGPGNRLTVATTRIQQGRWYARFEEVTDRDGAESLRGAELTLSVDPDEEAAADPDAWYPAQLRGLEVHHVDGGLLGTVVAIEHYPAQDVLVVRTQDGSRVMLPFVRQLVPEVDTAGGLVRADPPAGLFDADGEA